MAKQKSDDSKKTKRPLGDDKYTIATSVGVDTKSKRDTGKHKPVSPNTDQK